ncbi:MAG: extracellular solute-binding protein [Hyphomicrobiales bacterium]|nr:extracellular solute-binding protein [Hyphomicrobiales bacterium]
MTPPSTLIRRLAALALALAFVPLAAAPAPARADGPRIGIAMHGKPALAEGFDHLPYANPDAPKGGTLHLAYLGAFDSLNPFNVKALSTSQGLIGNVYQSLMERSRDEPFTMYGLVAKSIETDAARDYVTFRIDPRAKFSDGKPVTGEDVLFTFELLKAKGRPQQRIAYSRVKAATLVDPMTVRFDLAGADDRELPLILGFMPVLPKHAVDAATFQDATLEKPVATGPYVVAEVVPGQRLVLKKNPDYWAKDLPIDRGRFNFDEIDIDYYRSPAAMFEAFKAGLYDWRPETDPQLWAKGYDFPAAKDGRVVKLSSPNGLPKGLTGIAFNTRRKPFDDVRVREALDLMFDFEWIDANLYGGVYARTKSFFDDSALSSVGRPASDAEKALLAPFPGAVRADAMAGTLTPPVSAPGGFDRTLARRAVGLLAQAGWKIGAGGLLGPDGKRLSIELLADNRDDARLLSIYAESLKRIGIAATIRLVDDVQFQRRREAFDFDMMIAPFYASPSPGNEQFGRWGSAAADIKGSYNVTGASSPAIDAMIRAMLAARSQEDFVAAVRALDRVLLSGFYVIPLFHQKDDWLAHWNTIAGPPKPPMFGYDYDTWWSAKK